MSVRNLDGLLAPKSVALIGASTRAGSLGSILTHNLRAGGFQGPLWLINPRFRDGDDPQCYSAVESLPSAPDLAVIATPPETIPGLIADLGRRGTRAAVVITAGVKAELRQAMLDAAKPHLLRIQGPNCLGLMLPGLGVEASFCHRFPKAGDLALVSQSGALITAIVDWAASRSIGFSHIVSLGDMADVDVGDMLDYLAADITSRAILLYVEQLTHAQKFMSAARRASRSKPVIVIKSGRHAEGAKAAQSHTGALAGSDAAYAAAFRRAGILRVNELEDLFNAAEILSHVPALDGERLLILTNGGGAGVLAADRLADLGGKLVDLPRDLIDKLSSKLPPTWSRANPIDIIGDADEARYRHALECVFTTQAADAVLVMHCPTAMVSGAAIATTLIDTHKAAAAADSETTTVLSNWLGESAASEARHLLTAAGIATFATPAAAVEGFMQLVQYRRAQDELMQTPPPRPDGMIAHASEAGEIIASALAADRHMLSEVEAKRLLISYNIPTVPTDIARTPDDVATAAAAILRDNGACVIKILSDDISHKSDVGGVRLGLESVEAARQAAVEMLTRTSRVKPGARIAGFTVQPMVRRPRAHELLIGMSVDATFGPMLMFGAGDTAVKVVADTALALAPLDLKLAHQLMRQTRVHRLLQGYRDRPPADLDAIVRVLVQLSGLVIAHPEIHEIDINPLLADETGVIALDARIRIECPKAKPRTALSIRPYPVQWTKTVDVPGFGRALLRPIRPEDEKVYRAFLSRLTPEDTRLRFFMAKLHVSPTFVARMTQIDYAREMAFVAIDETTGAIIGISRLAADPDYQKAEYAVGVASELKGRGLGWTLMQTLIDYARSEGITELFGDVLSGNVTMLEMCRNLGFSIQPSPDDATLNAVALTL